jgi:hypothetical protein
MTAEQTGVAADESAPLCLGPPLARLLATFVALFRKICAAPLATPCALRKWLLYHDQVRTPALAQLKFLGHLGSQLSVEAAEGPSDWFPLTPVQRWFFGLNLAEPNHFNQCILLRNEGALHIDPVRVAAALRVVLGRHSALCHRFARVGPGGALPNVHVAAKVPNEPRHWGRGFVENEWAQRVAPLEEVLSQCVVVEEFDIGSASCLHSTVAAAVLKVQKSIDIEKGPLLRCALIRTYREGCSAEQIVAVVVHHLVMDGVSQRVLIEDLTLAYKTLGKASSSTRGGVATTEAALAPPPPSFRKWCLYALGAVVPRLRAQPDLAPWPDAKRVSDVCVFSPKKAETWFRNNTEGAAEVLYVNFNVDETDQVLAATASNAASLSTSERVGATELFIAALALAFRTAGLNPAPLNSRSDSSLPSSFFVDLEGHGRDDWHDIGCRPPAVDVSQTVGWFTALYPVEVPFPTQYAELNKHRSEETLDFDLLDMVSASISAFQRLPDRRSSFGLRDLAPSLSSQSYGRILFNFLGQFGHRLPVKETVSDATPLRFVFDPAVDATWSSSENRRSHDIIVDGNIVDGLLRFSISFCPLNEPREDLKELANSFRAHILNVANAIETRRAFWARADAVLNDHAEVPEIPPPLHQSAPTGILAEVGASAEVWLDEKRLNFLVCKVNHGNIGFDVIFAALFLETLRRWTSSTPGGKPIAALLQKAKSRHESFDLIPIIQPLNFSAQKCAAQLFESVSQNLVFASKTCVRRNLASCAEISEKTPVLCIALRAENFFCSHAPGHAIPDYGSSDGNFIGSSASAIPVYCLHYAGGSAALFSAPAWQSSGVMSVVPVELPGHGARRGEKLLESIDALAEDVIRSLGLGLSAKLGPFCLLGYSFGALVMQEVARRLEKIGTPPSHLFVAAEAAPEDVISAVDPVRWCSHSLRLVHFYIH